MSAQVIKVTINGRELELERQMTVLQAARGAGIRIPTLCNHPGLPMWGGCRLCVVEIEKMPRLQTACTVMVTDGMVVNTESETIAAARRGMLEFILTNHPLDCPFCDKAGECELQDLVYQYGATEGRFREPKIKHPESNVDPVLTRNIERCIACTRCVRMCDNVQGAQAIAMINRGNKTVMEPFSGANFDCEYCGNCLTVCPVGSILSRLYKDSYRPWQVERTVRTVCSYCGVGCSFDVQVRDEAIKRVIPRIPEGVNKGLLCARGRFGYEYVDSDERLTRPMVRRNGGLVEVSWDEALDTVARRLEEIRKNHGGGAVAGLASLRGTNEDNYAFQKLLRGVIGTNHIDSGARMGYAGAQAYLEGLRGQGVTANLIEGIGRSDVVLVTGGDPTVVTPVLGLQVRQAARSGGTIVSLDPAAGLAHFEPLYAVPKRATENVLLEAVVALLLKSASLTGELPALETAIREAAAITPAEAAAKTGVSVDALEAAAAALAGAEALSIVIGPDLVQRSDGHRGLFFLAAISYVTGGHLFLLSDRPNEQGVIDMGCLPDTLPGGRPLLLEGFRKRYEETSGLTAPTDEGRDLFGMLEGMNDGSIKALYVMGENPVFNLPDGPAVLEALAKLEFLVVQDIFPSETTALADVVLPALAWAEKDGTYTNLERRIQRVRRGVYRDGRADWQILAEIMNRLGKPQSWETAGDVFTEIAEVSPVHRDLHMDAIEKLAPIWPYHGEPLRGEAATVRLETAAPQPPAGEGLALITDRTLFASGTTSRRATALERLASAPVIRLHPDEAAAYGITPGSRVRLRAGTSETVEAEAVSDATIPPGAVALTNHFAGAGAFGLMSLNGRDPLTGAPDLRGNRVRVELVP